MTALRVEIPPGIASPVWLAHIVRNALTRALAGDLPDPRSLRVEVDDRNEGAAQGFSNVQQARSPTSGSTVRDPG